MRPWRSDTGGPAIRVRILAALDRNQLLAQITRERTYVAVANRVLAIATHQHPDARQDRPGSGQGGLSIARPFQHPTHGKHPLLCLVAVVAGECQKRVTGDAVENGLVQTPRPRLDETRAQGALL